MSNNSHYSGSPRYYKGGRYSNQLTTISNADTESTRRLGKTVYFRQKYRRITRLYIPRLPRTKRETVFPRVQDNNWL